MDMQNKLILDAYFPQESLKITEIRGVSERIIIGLKSITQTCECPKCHNELKRHHGTYVRKVQDLPILGKNVQLQITGHKYQCDNEECSVTTVAESYNGFLNTYSRMTERCADFVCSLALETSCEGCARICRAMHLKINGDTVIRLLTKRFEQQEKPLCGAVIGVDDFAFKKRHTYGTIIVDEATHRPIAILDGRDKDIFKQWLQKNKPVKMVTRDRASAYAAAIHEVLPDAIQIADRFHLHQNLLEAIRHTVSAIVPANIKIQKDQEVSGESETDCEITSLCDKKN